MISLVLPTEALGGTPMAGFQMDQICGFDFQWMDSGKTHLIAFTQ